MKSDVLVAMLCLVINMPGLVSNIV